jgi:hypothetical protein
MEYYSATRKTWIIAISLFIVTLLAMFFKMHGAPATIAIRYNVLIGVNQVGSKYELLKIPMTGLVIGLVNFSLARFQKFDKNLLPFLAALVTAVVNAFLLMAMLFLFRVS